MAKLTPQQAREKHARRLKGATEDIRRGINQVTQAPGEAAAAKVDKMRARLLASIDDGTWERRVKAVGLEEWKRLMLEKGVGRIAAGVDGAADKIEKFYGQLFAHQDTLQSKVKAMPDLSLEDSIQRMTTWVRGMAEFRKE